MYVYIYINIYIYVYIYGDGFLKPKVPRAYEYHITTLLTLPVWLSLSLSVKCRS